MNIQSLPNDCFIHILHFLSIDERIRIRPIFPHFDLSFHRLFNDLKRSKAFGIDVLNVSNAVHLDHSTKRLCSRFHLDEQWHCSQLGHIYSENFSCNNSLQLPCHYCSKPMILCILKHCPLIESIDLRGVKLSVSLIEGILHYCPKICCLRLNFSTFDSIDAFKLFVFHLCPKIKHFSCDNLICNISLENPFSIIFANLGKLIQMEIVLFPNEKLTPTDLLLIETNQLRFLSIQFLRTNRENLLSDPSDYISMLSQNKAKSLEYLKIKSNYNYELNFNIFTATKEFQNLIGLNLSFMNFFKSKSDFRLYNCWPKLESLTLDMYSLRGSNQLLTTYFEGDFKLKSLRIHDCRLTKSTLCSMIKNCQNLSILQFIDVKFNNVGLAFNQFQQLKNLKTLYIEYTIKWGSYDDASRTQLVNLYRFPAKQINHLIEFFQSSKSLMETFFINWPGLKRAYMTECEQISNRRKIFFCLDEY